MDSQKITFDKIIAVVCIAAVIAFAVFRSAQVTKQNETLNYTPALQFNYK